MRNEKGEMRMGLAVSAEEKLAFTLPSRDGPSSKENGPDGINEEEEWA